MQETRLRIVELLRVRGGQTVPDLVVALRLSRTAVISHLGVLQAEGLVRRRGLRRGKRRPSAIYETTRAADSAFPQAYESFAAAVLNALKEDDPPALRAALRRVGEGWVERDRHRVEGLKGKARVQATLQILKERGFLPALERAGSTQVLREHNCPVLRLASDHSEVCNMVHRWMESLVGAPLVRVQCMRRGDAFSEYHSEHRRHQNRNRMLMCGILGFRIRPLIRNRGGSDRQGRRKSPSKA
jgi:predicted ArsR family transcriptional regulator